MTLALEKPRNIGGRRIAAVCEFKARGHGHDVVFFVGRKHPVAVLIAQGDRLDAYALDGTPLDARPFEDELPNLRAAMTG